MRLIITKMEYTSIATPPTGVVLTQKYVLEKDSNGYFYTVGKDKVYVDIELIKCLFTPISKTWDETIKPVVKSVSKKEMK